MLDGVQVGPRRQLAGVSRSTAPDVWATAPQRLAEIETLRRQDMTGLGMGAPCYRPGFGSYVMSGKSPRTEISAGPEGHLESSQGGAYRIPRPCYSHRRMTPSIWPSSSISHLTVSPSLRTCLGDIAQPTPAGVPV